MGSNGHEAAFKMVAEEMLDKLPLGVMQIDRDFTVRFLNAVGARAIGRTAAEVVGKKCYELMQTAHCRTAECRCAQAMQRDAICNGETIARPNGNALPIDYGAAPVHGASGIVGALEFFSDVSVRRRAVDEIVSVSDRLAAGDLTVRAALAFEGDYRVIAENLNRSIEAQHDAVAGVVQSIAELAAASEEIAASSQQLAQGASEQASSLEQTAAALEELASQTKQNAASTRRAQSLAERSFGAAEAGSEAMTRMVTTMGKIRRAAADTSAIIRDINEIAFQTNLLALNAAVEAARAGDAGRGFAVVAEEVRSLALRAKEAARKTEELIAGSLKLSEEGEGVSADVSSKLNEIVHSVREVTGIAADIAQASDSQAQAIEHVNQALAEVDKVVQSTAGSAEQSASAAESLSSQAQRLAQTVNVFQVAHDRGGADLTLEPRNAVASRQARATRPHGRTGAGRGGGGSTGSARAARQLIPLDDEEALGDF